MADYLLGYMSNSESQIGAPIANFRQKLLLRAVCPRRVEGDAEAHHQLRFALGSGAALHRQTRCHRKHRLRLGQQPRTSLRSRRHWGTCWKAIRSSRWGRRSNLCAMGASADAPRKPTGPTSRPASASLINLHTRRPSFARAEASTGCATSATRCLIIVRNIPFTIRQNEVANLRIAKPVMGPAVYTNRRADVHPGESVRRAGFLRRAVVVRCPARNH